MQGQGCNGWVVMSTAPTLQAAVDYVVQVHTPCILFEAENNARSRMQGWCLIEGETRQGRGPNGRSHTVAALMAASISPAADQQPDRMPG